MLLWVKSKMHLAIAFMFYFPLTVTKSRQEPYENASQPARYHDNDASKYASWVSVLLFK